MSQKTKERILQTALDLFNNRGLSQVPSRAITTQLDISQGHLTYYFAKRADIMDTLFAHYKDQMNVILDTPTENTDLYTFELWLVSILEINYTFRFLFLDFAQVMRESSIFKKHYLRIRRVRKERFLAFMDALALKGDFEQIYQQVELILEFGMMYEVMQGKMSRKKILTKLQGDLMAMF